MESVNIDKLYKEFSYLRSVGSKEPKVKIINDLIRNKKVEDESLFIIEGLWAYEKIIKGNIKIKTFAFCPEYIKNYSMANMVRYFVNTAEESCVISSNLCSRLSSRDREEGFFILCSFPTYTTKDIKLKKDNLLVILDGLEKPGNIGTIVRSTDAAGGDGIIICNSKVRRTNSKLIKSSMGSSFSLPIIERDINETIIWLKNNNFKIIVTDLKATKSYHNVDYTGRVAIIAGNEIRGISNLWDEHHCERVIIPMFGEADSLNVGVAATLVIYEASSQQRKIVKRCV